MPGFFRMWDESAPAPVTEPVPLAVQTYHYRNCDFLASVPNDVAFGTDTHHYFLIQDKDDFYWFKIPFFSAGGTRSNPEEQIPVGIQAQILPDTAPVDALTEVTGDMITAFAQWVAPN